jgi:glycolate oxidase
VSAIVAAGVTPRCLEMLDAATLEAVRKAGVAIDARAGGMLLIEVDGDAAEASLVRVGEVATAEAGCIDVVVAQDAGQRDRLWAARRMLSKATRKLARHKLSEDVVVPRTRIADLLARTDAIAEQTGIRNLSYGHAGDGNLHVNFLWNDASERPAVERSIELLMRATIEMGGTLSGEHGIGVTKAAYLHFEQSDELIALQQDIKRAFDPKGLLNPGKIFPAGAAASHRAC